MQQRLPYLACVFVVGAAVCAACGPAQSAAPDASDTSSGSSASSGSMSGEPSDAAPACVPDNDKQFVAQVPDFNGFCKWSSAPAMAEADAADGLHGVGPLTVYWNKTPPHGCSEFPVGTIIVKETQEADPS